MYDWAEPFVINLTIMLNDGGLNIDLCRGKCTPETLRQGLDLIR